MSSLFREFGTKFGPIGEILNGGPVLPVVTAEQIAENNQAARESMQLRHPEFFRQQIELPVTPTE